MKVYKKLAGCFLVIGIILGLIGISMNGLSQIKLDTHHVEKYARTFTFGKTCDVNEEMAIDGNSDISIELSAVEAKIVYYDGTTLKVEAKNIKRDYTFDNDDGDIDIVLEGKSNITHKPKATLYIPRHYQFKDADLEINATSLNMEGIECNNLSIEHNAGSLTINQVTCHQSMDVENNAGDVVINNILCKDLDLDNSVGSMKVSMAESIEHYTIDKDGDMSSINIEGGNGGHGENKIEINCDLGNIDVSFKEVS